MDPLTLVALLLLCAALLRLAYRRRHAWRASDAVWPFQAGKPLARPRDVLYQRLVRALPGHTILAHVPLAGVLAIKRGADVRAWSRRIQHLYFDFVVCGRDAAVLAAIVLEGQVNARASAPFAEVRARAAAAAGVRLLRWSARDLPDVAALQESFGQMQIPAFEDSAASANQSWWSTAADAARPPPRA